MDMLALPDNSLLVAGYYDEESPTALSGVSRNGIVYKIDSSGTLDSSFATGGFLTYGEKGYTTLFNIATTSDGNIFLSGTTGEDFFSPDQVFVLKLTSDGDIDTTFGTNGIAYHNFTGYDSQSFGMAIQSDGDIILGCRVTNSQEQRYGLVSFDSNGDLDTSFATGGAYLSDNLSYISPPVHNVVVQSDDTIITSMETINTFTSQSASTVTRFTASGLMDSNFGVGGVLDISQEMYYRRMLRKQDGQVIVAGTNRQWSSPAGPEVLLHAFSSSGTDDNSFGDHGRATINTADNSATVVNDIKEGPSGRIYFITDIDEFIDQFGDTYRQGIQLVRVNRNGSLDTLFGDNGKWIYNTATPEQGRIFAVLPNGTIYIGGMRGDDQIYEETLLLKVTIEE